MRKVLLAALLAPLCEAARSTWSAEMAECKDTACFQKPAPASAAAAAGADAEPAGACAGRVCAWARVSVHGASATAACRTW